MKTDFTLKSFLKRATRSPFLIALAVLALVACGKSGPSANVTPTNGTTTLVTPPRPSSVNIPLGFYAQNDKMNYLYPGAVGSTLNIQSPGMANVLKYAMGVCERNYISGGQARCDAWVNGLHDMMLFASGSQASKVKLVIRSMLDQSCQTPYSCGSYWYSLPNFTQLILGAFGFNTLNNAGVYDPMILDMTVWPINNSRGFELRGYAPGGATYQGGNNLLFQFQVAVGKLDDPAWDFVLYYNSVAVANGHMLRCVHDNCGVVGL